MGVLAFCWNSIQLTKLILNDLISCWASPINCSILTNQRIDISSFHWVILSGHAITLLNACSTHSININGPISCKACEITVQYWPIGEFLFPYPHIKCSDLYVCSPSVEQDWDTSNQNQNSDVAWQTQNQYIFIVKFEICEQECLRKCLLEFPAGSFRGPACFWHDISCIISCSSIKDS